MVVKLLNDERALVFGMNVVGYDSVLSEQFARAFGIEPVPLGELFKNADFITIRTPLTKLNVY